MIDPVEGDEKPTAPRIEQRLFESEQRFRLLVQGVRDYAIYMLDLDGRITNWNKGAERIKGYQAEEVLGEHFSRFYTEEDRAAGLPRMALETALRDGKCEHEGWRVRKDGSRFWASVVIDPIRDDDGRLVGFAKVTRDITESRQVQEELEKAREALAQSQKMEAVGRLTGGVAHDFNNLLTVIRASVDMLRRFDLPPEKRERYLAAIADTADRGALLTRQLLAFSRREPLQTERFDVADRIRGLRQIIATTVGSQVSFTIDVDTDTGVVDADPAQFETAILNMVINARDAMPGGGNLTITSRQNERGPPDGPDQMAQAPCVAVTVADDGTGIEPEQLDRIFEPFFTTKEAGKGTGLGLSQVYGFARQSEGDIRVESTVGVGTAFTLYLPLADKADAMKCSPASEPGAAQVMKGGRILVVEDNEGVAQFAKDVLSELGQEVRLASDYASAIATIESDPAGLDLVFSDVVMPGDSGIDLAKEISRRWPGLPVVLTSGYSHVLAEEGSHGFELLRKPYSLDALVEMLQRPRRSAAPRT
jgi:PAS domain S-box-containing protein